MRSERGVTLVDTIVGSALMLVVFTGIAAAFQLSVEVISNNKARAGAIALANERMEYLKSLSYTQIGVIGGIPAGNVPQIETVTANAVTYTRRTIVFYSDDPGDGTGISDTNSIIADYKTIRVEISWISHEGERSVTLVGRVSPLGVESSVPGGTLTVNVVNASSTALFNAQVDIINTGTNPAINIRTYTDTTGIVSFIGAPAASNYQVTVSKPGYSTAQTYPVTAQNPNPTPRHLTVSNNQTTSATFAIDTVSTKTVQTYKSIARATSTDALSTGAGIATTTNVSLSGGLAQLDGPPYPASGFVLSGDISPALLYEWETLSWVDTTPTGTDVLYRLYAGSGDAPPLLPDSVLPGNSIGFTNTPITITGISTTTYPALRIGATFSSDSSATPTIDSWSIAYDFGPEPLPNFPFTMRGSKTIGNSPTVYKYNTTHTTDASASVTLQDIEWDTYLLGATTTSGYDLAESCAPQPESIMPGTTQTTKLYFSPDTAHSLRLDVRSNTGALVTGASVHLTRTGYDQTNPTSACGQAFFAGLTNAAYSITVSKAGFQNYTNASFTVSGNATLSVVLQP